MVARAGEAAAEAAEGHAAAAAGEAVARGARQLCWGRRLLEWRYLQGEWSSGTPAAGRNEAHESSPLLGLEDSKFERERGFSEIGN